MFKANQLTTSKLSFEALVIYCASRNYSFETLTNLEVWESDEDKAQNFRRFEGRQGLAFSKYLGETPREFAKTYFYIRKGRHVVTLADRICGGGFYVKFVWNDETGKRNQGLRACWNREQRIKENKPL